MYAGVIAKINTSKLDRIFTYRVPKEMEEEISIGREVIMPFGKGNREMAGYVVSLSKTCSLEEGKIKSLLFFGDGMDVDARLVELAAWIRENFGGTMIQALKSVLPVKKKVKVKKNNVIRLILTDEEAREWILFFKKKHQSARLRFLEALICEGEVPSEYLGRLGITKSVIDFFEKKEIISISEPDKKLVTIKTTPLNTEQQMALSKFKENYLLNKRKNYLLYGVTGSGKTEVYMEMIALALERKKEAIVLIPEIALTFQTVMRFRRRFGDRIAVMHSRLSEGEKYIEMEKARKGLVDVIIGPRSALFAPFKNLGLIIIDEEHEPSYKSGQVPKYHARDVALKIGVMTNSSVILGSATPSIESMYRAKKGEYVLLELKNRATKKRLPEIEIVDMREEVKSGNTGIISDKLLSNLMTTLNRGDQAMLFINRRGYLGVLSCKECGEVVMCPHCDVSLTEHRGGVYRCHYCGYEKKNINKCPSCGSLNIGGLKSGTQQVEDLIRERFPGARVLRMDKDTTRKKGEQEKILEAFRNREADILIGTQMIVKGHDFPGVTLVSALSADMSLYAPDYMASERTFSLLVQASGRAGRGLFDGKSIIQTYSPDNFVLSRVKNHDYLGFYSDEVEYRDMCGYPPVREMMNILLLCKAEGDIINGANYLGEFCKYLKNKGQIKELTILGPVTPNIGKINDVHRREIVLKDPNKKILVWMKNQIEKYIELNSGYKNISVQFDFNPVG